MNPFDRSGNIDLARGVIAAALELPTERVPADGTIETVPGWDSIGHVRIILAIETHRGERLPPEEMLRAIDVPSVAELLG